MAYRVVSCCVRPGQVSFDERSYNLATLPEVSRWKAFGASNKEDRDLGDQIAASIVGGTE